MEGGWTGRGLLAAQPSQSGCTDRDGPSARTRHLHKSDREIGVWVHRLPDLAWPVSREIGSMHESDPFSSESIFDFFQPRLDLPFKLV